MFIYPDASGYCGLWSETPALISKPNIKSSAGNMFITRAGLKSMETISPGIVFRKEYL
jgi:hypothetical protein